MACSRDQPIAIPPMDVSRGASPQFLCNCDLRESRVRAPLCCSTNKGSFAVDRPALLQLRCAVGRPPVLVGSPLLASAFGEFAGARPQPSNPCERCRLADLR